LLTPADLQLVLTCRGDANRCGMALLLKALAYLGYFPEKLDRMPGEVRSFTGALPRKFHSTSAAIWTICCSSLSLASSPDSKI
jgi:hypothetical protein